MYVRRCDPYQEESHRQREWAGHELPQQVGALSKNRYGHSGLSRRVLTCAQSTRVSLAIYSMTIERVTDL